VASYTQEDGLASNGVMSVREGSGGTVWFGTFHGGVSVYDGEVFQSITAADGLASNTVHGLAQDRQGDVWISTEPGVTRYTPSRSTPRVALTQVATDRPLGPAQRVELTFPQSSVRIEVGGSSLTTPVERMRTSTASSAAMSTIYGLRRRRDLRRTERARTSEPECQIQVAHDLQTGLMPFAAPALRGCSMTGRCLSANQVGG